MSTSDKLNTIAMGVLSAALFALGGKTFIDILAREHAAEKPGYVLPKPKVAEGGAGAVAAKFSFAQVATLLPAAKAEAGEETFKKCAACHNNAKGADKKVGPNLWGVIGRPVGKVAGFEYSDVMKGKGGDWNWDTLATYLHEPAAALPGNKMAFAGIEDTADLADLLAYLRQHADTPVDLPAVPAAAAPAPAAPAAPK